jgi:ADP-heptose:LPS heptosyltransferase
MVEARKEGPPIAEAPRSVLVYVGQDLIGDGLIKLPFVRALRAAFPEAHLTWVAGKGRSVYAGVLAPLVAGLLDEVIDDANFGSTWTDLFRRPLAGRAFDLVIDTQRRFLTTLIVRRIRARCFVSGAGNFIVSSRRPRAYRRPPAMIRQMLDLIEVASGRPAMTAGAYPLPADKMVQAKALLPDGPAYVGLAPGAGMRVKCWPLDRFIALARLQRETGHQPVFLLGPQEQEWLPGLREALPQAQFPLQAPGVEPDPLLSMALATRLAAAVANDSGVGHILAAGGAPLVSLFGPTSPDKFAPCAAVSTIITAQEFGSEAMDAIPVAVVAAALDRLLTAR